MDLARNKAEMSINYKTTANVSYQSVDHSHDKSIRLPSPYQPFMKFNNFFYHSIYQISLKAEIKKVKH